MIYSDIDIEFNIFFKYSIFKIEISNVNMY